MMLLVLGGCGASNMGFLMIPLEMGLLMIVDFIVNRQIQLRMILTLFIINIPTAAFALLYLLNKK